MKEGEKGRDSEEKKKGGESSRLFIRLFSLLLLQGGRGGKRKSLHLSFLLLGKGEHREEKKDIRRRGERRRQAGRLPFRKGRKRGGPDLITQ